MHVSTHKRLQSITIYYRCFDARWHMQATGSFADQDSRQQQPGLLHTSTTIHMQAHWTTRHISQRTALASPCTKPRGNKPASCSETVSLIDVDATLPAAVLDLSLLNALFVKIPTLMTRAPTETKPLRSLAHTDNNASDQPSKAHSRLSNHMMFVSPIKSLSNSERSVS